LPAGRTSGIMALRTLGVAPTIQSDGMRALSASAPAARQSAEESAMAKIFLSYRRADSAGVAGRIYDRLGARFGAANIFKDVDDIPAGVHFGAYIREALAQCAVVLVLIGPRWLDAPGQDGTRRLDDPQDWVRTEIELALALKLTVLPVLVEG